MRAKQLFKAAIFDFDGTIADTMPILEQIAVELITTYYDSDLETARRGYIQTTGLPFFQQLEILFPNHSKNNEIATKFEETKYSRFFTQPLFSDTIETLTQLQQICFVCISSSTTQPLIERYCLENKLNVDCILGYRPNFEKGKAHFDYVVNNFNLEYSDLVFVGDSLKDGERAQINNVSFIGKVGLFSQQEFQKQGDIPTINSLEELINENWIDIWKQIK